MFNSKYIVIEWFDKYDGGLWQIIAFPESYEDALEIIKYRRKNSRIKIVKAEVEDIEV